MGPAHGGQERPHAFIRRTSPASPAALLVLVGAIVWLGRGPIVAPFTATPKAMARGAA